MRKTLVFAACLVTSLFASSCDEQGDNYLDGSIANTYRLGFDSVRIRLYESELSIEYLEDTSEGEKISLKVTLDLDDGLPKAGTKYDLVERGDIDRGAGYGSALPDMESAELRLDTYEGADGTEVKGSFSSVFIKDDGAKLTLRGGFKANLEVVE